MSSYSDFLRGVIIQEFHNQFEVKYSDNMYSSLVYYTDARTALRKNNISFREIGDGFSLYKGGEPLAEMQMGDYSAVFLNAWISESQQNLTLFPVGFGKAHPKTYQGKLAQASARYTDELQGQDITPQQADAGAVNLFLSDEVVTDGDNSIFRVDPKSVKAISRVDFEDGNKVSFEDDSDDDDDSDSEDEDKEKPAKEEKDKTKEKKQPAPFYYIIAMEKKGKVLDKLPKIWRNKIKEDGLSWEFDATEGRLYVSNTIGASYGLPPAPKHLCGLPKLNIKLDQWEGATTPDEVENASSSSTVTTVREPTGDTEWEAITEQFMTTPNVGTFDAFKNSDEIFKAFELHKKDAGYKMGSNKNPLSDNVRKVMRGEEKAITWPEFTELLNVTARPNDTKGIMILLFKIRLYVEQTRDGKVYVSK